ncbi:MAG: PAS domain-containing sensor histidine kinase [Thermoguttaceae bacterium]
MNEKQDTDSGPPPARDLRRAAEQRLRDKEALPGRSMAAVDARAVVHELQVHQIELEMQNEDLLRARAAAQEASDKYQDLFDFAPVGYFLLDRQGQILEVNLAGAALLGLDRSTALKRRLGQYVAAQSLARFAEFCDEVLRADSTRLCEIEFQRGDGRVWALLEGIRTHDGRENRFFRVAVMDITERKQAEQEMADARLSAEQAKAVAEKALAVAEQANRAKDHFLAVLSHELRTPLTPVVMGVSMLQDRPDLDPEVRETLEMVHRHVQMEARLVDDLLDVSRIARGKVELNRTPIELCTVIRRAVEVCEPDIEARRLYFGVDLGPGAPYWVDADVARLQQVFWNLLKNAIKFTPHDGCVGIRCRHDDAHVMV